MSALAGSAGSQKSSSPKDAPGNAPSRDSHGNNPGAPRKPSPDDINTDALQATLEALNSKPESLDMALLTDLTGQLEEFEADPDTDWGDDPKVQMLSTTVQGIVHEQLRRLDLIASEEMSNFYTAVENRGPCEQNMIDDERQYRALSRIRDSKRYSSDAPDRDIQDDDRVNMHTTRTRTTMYAARLGDMIFPTNDYPVRIVAPENPNPDDYPGYAAALEKATQEAAQAAQQQAQASGQPPQPIDPTQPALSIKDYADAAAAKMQMWVFKNFDDQHLTKKGRETLENGAKLGLGLFYGPFPEISRRRVPRQTEDGSTLEMSVEETMVPGLEARDPWRFFYDMTKNLEESNACYYLQLWTVRQLAEFREYPKVVTVNVDALLAKKPPQINAKLASCINNRGEQTGMKEPLEDRYAVVEVDRIIRPEKLKDVLGIEWEHKDLPLIKMWICDGKCLKFKLSPLEHDWRPPYYNFGIMPKDDTVFWYSVPTMGRAGQKFIDGALNATLFNAAASVAPIIVTNKGQVQPNNERWRLGGMVIFNNLNPDLPARDVFSSMTVASNVDGNLQMLSQALSLFDDDTMYEQILSGSISGEKIAASQLAQIVNLASVFQRRLAGYVDDYLIGPYTERMVWWGNLYGTDDEIDMKGPHVVKPIAATQFVSKDILIQHLQAFTQLSDNPKYGGFADDYKLYRANANLLDIPDLDDIIYPRDKALAERAKLQSQQGGPDAAKMADVERQRAKDQADIEIEKMRIQTQATTDAFRMKTDVEIQNSKERVAVMELMKDREIDMAALNAQLAEATMDKETQTTLAMLDGTIQSRLKILDLTHGGDPHSAKD